MTEHIESGPHDFDMSLPVRDCVCRQCGCNIRHPASDRECPNAMGAYADDGRRRASAWSPKDGIPPWWDREMFEAAKKAPPEKLVRGTKFLEAFGLSATYKTWAAITGLGKRTVYMRTKNDWTPHDTLCTPLTKRQ